MDGYLQILGSLEDYNPQVLAPETLEQALTALKQQLLKTEAAKLLLPAKELPFSRVALGRLSSLLSLVYKPAKQHESRIIALRGLDSVSQIICGLCLTQKVLESMRKDLFEVLLEQAVVASQASVKVVATSDEINKVVLSSAVDEEFLKHHLGLRRMVSGAVWPSLQYSLAGNPSWCYSKVLQPSSSRAMYPRLLSKAIRGYITTFLPSEESTDGLIRFMIPFDQNLLRSLFGWGGTDAIDAEHFSVRCAVKNQIAPAFGVDVFEAVTSSHKWGQDTGEIETRCLGVDVYPAQLMMISLTIGWTSCYHFVNSLYRS
ncbi:hypothetical protein HIM_09641 [Hirsutella minnesotensis 3608]|uniref:Uncharacterized protein n=1 Tax=Hirsutella minnesotensis 3608 TaxID=1043627 RepID=A0A0F7ZGJ2_9HYPO|nr:hypothetical protein HIM_09641 [Hirsutella minnesotensis 3608]